MHSDTNVSMEIEVMKIWFFFFFFFFFFLTNVVNVYQLHVIYISKWAAIVKNMVTAMSYNSIYFNIYFKTEESEFMEAACLVCYFLLLIYLFFFFFCTYIYKLLRIVFLYFKIL